MFDVQKPRLKSPAANLQTLNQRAWVAGFSFSAYGVRVGVRTNDARLLEKLLPHLPPRWKMTHASVERLYSIFIRSRINRKAKKLHELYVDDEKFAEMAKPNDLLQAFESDLQLYVADRAPRRVFVHAGVVGWKGKAILLPGRSFSGKTTLVAALVKAGALYYSDEYAVLDERGFVHAYPRSLSVRENGNSRGTKYAVEDLGGKAGSKPLPVGLVLVSKFKAGAQFKPREISAGESVLALLHNTVSARRQPHVVLGTLKKAIASARSIKSSRGESEAVVAAVLENCPANR